MGWDECKETKIHGHWKNKMVPFKNKLGKKEIEPIDSYKCLGIIIKMLYFSSHSVHDISIVWNHRVCQKKFVIPWPHLKYGPQYKHTLQAYLIYILDENKIFPIESEMNIFIEWTSIQNCYIHTEDKNKNMLATSCTI